MASGLSARTLLLRDWRSGELSILLAALVLAVAVVVSISAFVGSLESTLKSESLRFLAADRVVQSSRGIPDQWAAKARDHALQTAMTLGFPSMVVTDNDAMYLASIKAVSDGYPLRGELQQSIDPYGAIETTKMIPAPGEVWLAPRLFALLGIDVGATVWVGEAPLRVTGTIRGEPDSTSAMFGYGPRLLMNLVDIDTTGVIQPGSRVQWRLLLAGNPVDLQLFSDWLAPQLSQGQRLLGVNESQPSIGRTLERAQGFLLLAGSLGVVLAATAIALAARRFSERHTDAVAVMKSLGASTQRISRLYGGALLLLGAIATVLGCGLGWLVKAAFFALFGSQLGIAAGGSGVEPYLIGAVTAVVCLGFFAWPPLRRLGRVPPLRVLRRDVDASTAQRAIDYLLGGVAMIALMLWYSGDLRLTAGVVGGLIVAVVLGFVMARVLLGGTRVVGSAAGSVWRLALAGLVRRGNANSLQMVIFGIAIMLLLILVMVRTSLIDQWQAQLPPGTPNHFLLNIAPEQRGPLERFFDVNGIDSEAVYPMTRGRVMAVNGVDLAQPDSVDSERRQREANFTYSNELPPANDILEGSWWPADTQESLVSIEQGFAQGIGARVGDTLDIRIGAQALTVTVSSVRSAEWQSMKPNFFMIFPPSVLASFPKVYLTSFYLPKDRKATLNDLVRAFPTLTIIELDVVIEEIRSIVNRVGQGIELVLAVILSAGALVLVAGVQASVDVRLRESALLRALGARKGLLLGALWIEFATLGACAGVLAIAGAEVAVWALQTQALDLYYRPSYTLWPAALVAGAAIIGALGVLSCRRAVQAPPLVVLRDC